MVPDDADPGGDEVEVDRENQLAAGPGSGTGSTTAGASADTARHCHVDVHVPRFLENGCQNRIQGGVGHGGARRGAGRPTSDPKDERITVRLAARDVEALKLWAERRSVQQLAEAARLVLREALGVRSEPRRKR